MIDNIELFRDLLQAEKEDIAKYVRWGEYKKNESVIGYQDSSTDVYLIGEGSVKATTFSYSGKEIAYERLDAGQIFGEISAIDGLARTTSIICAEDSQIGSMASHDFRLIMSKHPLVANAVMLKLTGLIRFLCGRVYEFSALSVKDRIRAEIIRHARNRPNQGKDIELVGMPTHEEIANKISTHREAVTKEFSSLVKQGHLRRKGKLFEVVDLQELAKLITEEI